MKVGTKSLLFGVHQFVLHPLLVLIAWRIIFHRFPKFYELCAIITHDWGYWGSPNMDGPEGERHPEYSASFWFMWENEFCDKVSKEILGHSRFYASKNGNKISNLFRADKFSGALYPKWLYLLLGNFSGEIKEYMVRTDRNKDSQIKWLVETQAYMALMGLHGERNMKGLDKNGNI